MEAHARPRNLRQLSPLAAGRAARCVLCFNDQLSTHFQSGPASGAVPMPYRKKHFKRHASCVPFSVVHSRQHLSIKALGVLGGWLSADRVRAGLFADEIPIVHITLAPVF